MSFNFSNDDDPLPDIAKIIELLRTQMFDQLQEQGIDPQDLINEIMKNPQMRSFGFSISVGPDGQPEFKPIQSKMKVNTGFEEPFTDIFFSEQSRSFQIIIDLQGIDNLDLIHIRFDKTVMQLHAENGPFKYRLNKDLGREIKPETARFALNNGILQIDIQSK